MSATKTPDVRQGTFKVIIIDLVGLKLTDGSRPDHSEVAQFVEQHGGIFHEGGVAERDLPNDGNIHFFYLPHLSEADEILAETGAGQYDAVIAAATAIPAASKFALGGVRIGTGTGNMGSASWGGSNGEGGEAPLMNTPGINARATAQMAFKALLRVLPDLPVEALHKLVVDGAFDTGKDLVRFPTEKLEGKRFAILGFGNIGQEVAALAKAFGMDVVVYARPHHQDRIGRSGYRYAATPSAAASGADVISVHLGLGRLDPATNTFANAGLIDREVLSALNDGAVLINYDRGELVDVPALGKAFSGGKLRHAAIDADIFKGPDGPNGPMVPYLSLLPEHGEKLALLPHAAADTDHPTRVAGAEQAINQIMDAIRNRKVANLKGDLPNGYVEQGAPSGSGDAPLVARLQDISAALAGLVHALATQSDPEHQSRIVEEHRALIECLDLERYAAVSAHPAA
ncbi:NAD(P)-dependent oxidoreductase [Tianweitania populi]|uniref:D-isomer specific 2-hydroxyacid dehydrogenase NAD-binding domain-containing protein n=1 Tax=Tianweitania populi TaxID=1607949 RepID=A0A8J3GLQ0_9HYPH|nr:NAD(P)-dependent oxidoreductase [Tianweitania populi]GHD19409.1 hypothetical protein GCM10016234_31030 [Tianweitania populi]